MRAARDNRERTRHDEGVHGGRAAVPNRHSSQFKNSLQVIKKREGTGRVTLLRVDCSGLFCRGYFVEGLLSRVYCREFIVEGLLSRVHCRGFSVEGVLLPTKASMAAARSLFSTNSALIWLRFLGLGFRDGGLFSTNSALIWLRVELIWGVWESGMAVRSRQTAP